jgi:hypothetical protein
VHDSVTLAPPFDGTMLQSKASWVSGTRVVVVSLSLRLLLNSFPTQPLTALVDIPDELKFAWGGQHQLGEPVQRIGSSLPRVPHDVITITSPRLLAG